MQLHTANDSAHSRWCKRASSATLFLLAAAFVIGFVFVFAQAVRNSATQLHRDLGLAAWHVSR